LKFHFSYLFLGASALDLKFQTFKLFNRFAWFNAPTSFLPRVAGMKEGVETAGTV
jgi:hypothetical protein